MDDRLLELFAVYEFVVVTAPGEDALVVAYRNALGSARVRVEFAHEAHRGEVSLDAVRKVLVHARDACDNAEPDRVRYETFEGCRVVVSPMAVQVEPVTRAEARDEMARLVAPYDQRLEGAVDLEGWPVLDEEPDV